MQDLTTGSVTSHLLKTTSFMLVGMVFQTLYVLVDLYWVGQLGTEAVAAVGLSGNLMFVVLALTQMLGVGTTTLISHAAGRKDLDRATFVFNQAQVLSMTAGAAFFLVAMAGRSAYARALSADPATAAAAEAYLFWLLPGFTLQFAVVAMGSALRGIGDFKPGMIVQSGSVVLNMILSPILIFGWGTGRPMGVAGASLGTFLSIVVALAWVGTYFRGHHAFLRFDRALWRPRLEAWREMLAIGLPAGAEFFLMSVYLVIVYIVIRPFGSAAQAGFGIGMRVVQSGFLPVVALGFAVAPVAGQNVGARLPARVIQTFRAAAALATAAMALFVALAHLSPAALVRIFSDDPETIGIGSEYLRIISWNFVASGLVFVSSSMFQAMGHTLPSLVTSSTRILIFAVPVVLLSRQAGFQLSWIWYTAVTAVTLQMVFNLVLLEREFRRRLGVSLLAPSPAMTGAAARP
ncbi:MAG: MATE family efflux transporter [Vicinamibacterales bacterium]